MRAGWANIAGYLKLQVTGRDLERFINLGIANGLYFWNLQRRGGALLLEIKVSDFLRLRPIARKTHVRVHIVRKRGLPFFWRHMWQRQGLMWGAVLFGIALIYLSTFIWKVEIRGLRYSDPGVIEQELLKLGLKSGARKAQIDTDQLENVLMLRLSDRISWVGVNIRGTRAVVEVVERINPVNVKAVGDMVASTAGIVTRVLVVSGQKVANEGQTVRQGEVLIRGTQVALGGGEQAVRADGQVLARVWREEFATVAMQHVDRLRTGQVSEGQLLRLGEKEILFRGKVSSPYPIYDREEIKREPLGRINHFPVEIITIRYLEVAEQIQEYTREEALELAEAQAVEAIRSNLPVGAKVASQQVEILPGEGPYDVRVRVLVETLEDIGVFIAGDSR